MTVRALEKSIHASILQARERAKTKPQGDHEKAQQCLTKRHRLNVGQKARASLMDVTLIDRKSAV